MSRARYCFSVIALLGLCATGAAAQDPDSIPPVTPDTTAAQDTLPPPPPVLPSVSTPLPVGAGLGNWRWTRSDLLDTDALTLTDLLARIPGVLTFRTGAYLQPEVASAFGATAGRLEVEVDGVILDPLIRGSPDLAAITLAHLDSVIVERRLDQLRIRVWTATPTDGRPYSRIEAATGEPNANLFRGILLAPHLLFGPISLAVERFDTDGAGVPEPADIFAASVKWGWYSNVRGIQLELRTSRLDRDPDSPWPESIERRDLVVRARQRLTDYGALELYGVRTTQTTESSAEVGGESGQRKSTQLGIRAGYSRPMLDFDFALRTRDLEALPRIEADIGGTLRPIDRVTIRVDGEIVDWDQHLMARVLDVRGTVDLFSGVSVFGEWAKGRRRGAVWSSLAPEPEDQGMEGEGDGGGTTEPGVRASALSMFRTAQRGGAELRRGRALLRAEFARVDDDSIAPWGMPFDSAAPSLIGGVRTGVIVAARAPIPGSAFWVEGSFANWEGSGVRTYLPPQTWRGALLLDSSPLESGNLQFLGRLEVVHRDGVLGPSPTAEEPALTMVTPARETLNGFFEIRIMDLRIFIRSDDMAGSEIQDIPGRPILGPRILYGVKWSFWN